MRFIKYKILITKIKEEDIIVQKHEKIADKGLPGVDRYPDSAQYGYVDKKEINVREVEVLKMESEDENLDIKHVVKAILGM